MTGRRVQRPGGGGRHGKAVQQTWRGGGCGWVPVHSNMRMHVAVGCGERRGKREQRWAAGRSTKRSQRSSRARSVRPRQAGGGTAASWAPSSRTAAPHVCVGCPSWLRAQPIGRARCCAVAFALAADADAPLPPPLAAPPGNYIDHKCPFTGNVSIRGRILSGKVRPAAARTAQRRRGRSHLWRSATPRPPPPPPPTCRARAGQEHQDEPHDCGAPRLPALHQEVPAVREAPHQHLGPHLAVLPLPRGRHRGHRPVQVRGARGA